MRIGEIEARSGVTAKTIRYYEDIGVLNRVQRTPSGYRDYDVDVIDRLRFIRAAQALGLSLGEIRGIIAMRDRGETPCEHVVDLIARHAAAIDAQISELTRLKKDLVRLARRGKSLDPMDCGSGNICHVIEARSVRRTPGEG